MGSADDLKQRIEAIETGYEFMLAYAAQGRQTDKGAAAGRNVREYLDAMVVALEGLGSADPLPLAYVVRAIADDGEQPGPEPIRVAFVQPLERRHETLLYHVLGVHGIAGPSDSGGVRGAVELPHQALERPGVAATCLLNQPPGLDHVPYPVDRDGQLSVRGVGGRGWSQELGETARRPDG